MYKIPNTVIFCVSTTLRALNFGSTLSHLIIGQPQNHLLYSVTQRQTNSTLLLHIWKYPRGPSHFAGSPKMAPPGSCRKQWSPLRQSRHEERCPFNWVVPEGTTQAETHLLHNACAVSVFVCRLACTHGFFFKIHIPHLQHTFTSPCLLQNTK